MHFERNLQAGNGVENFEGPDRQSLSTASSLLVSLAVDSGQCSLAELENKHFEDVPRFGRLIEQ